MNELLRLFRAAPRAFWRHDVDIDIDPAVKMARFAEIAGVSSTFYLNPRCDFYNLLALANARRVEEIIASGHQIGLHCELRNGDVEGCVETDLTLLADVAPPTRAVSFHMPPASVLWRDFETFDNAYASRWKGHYLADSRGNPLRRRPADSDQVNLHPEWWF